MLLEECVTLTVGHNRGMTHEETPTELAIRDSMIRLGQALKLGSLVHDGAQARDVIEAGLVKVNGDIEERRGRQLHAGDIVTLNATSIVIHTVASSDLPSTPE